MTNRMKTIDDNVLSIKDKAKGTRRKMGVSCDVPVSENLVSFLEKEGITVCEYPFSKDSHIHANITVFKHQGQEFVFIGLNSNLYYDDRIFALAHKHYHYITKTGMAFSIDSNKEDEQLEKMADRYAAQLLLPDDALRDAAARYGNGNLDTYSINGLLRFIANLHLEWRIPYECIVTRLFEEGYILEPIKEQLLEINHRDEYGIYNLILDSIDSDISGLINSKPQKKGISSHVFEAFIRNFENGLISEQEFTRILNLFGRDPSDFGFKISVTVDEELEEFLEKEKSDEG